MQTNNSQVLEMPVKTYGLGEIAKAYKQGCEAFRKYCLRYGHILSINDYEENGIPFRNYLILIDGFKASIHMRKGEVREFGYDAM